MSNQPCQRFKAAIDDAIEHLEEIGEAEEGRARKKAQSLLKTLKAFKENEVDKDFFQMRDCDALPKARTRTKSKTK